MTLSNETSAPHFGPGCTCDTGGENPECQHHGYEAVIARYKAERESVREALTAFELTDKQAVARALEVLDG